MRLLVRSVSCLLLLMMTMKPSFCFNCETLGSFLVCYNGLFDQLENHPEIVEKNPDNLILNNFSGNFNLYNLRILNRVERLSINFDSDVIIDPGCFRTMPNLKLLALKTKQNSTNSIVYNEKILSGIRNLKSLDLDGGTLEEGALNNLPIYRASLTNMRFPRIITKATFGKLKHLEELAIWDSDLTSIGTNSFSGLINLRRLILSNVNLETISIGAFHNLPHLKQLILVGNRLRFISWDSFQGLKSLEVLNLQKNPLQNFGDQDMFAKIPIITPQLRELFLTCPEYLTEEQKYLMDFRMRSLGISFYCSNS